MNQTLREVPAASQADRGEADSALTHRSRSQRKLADRRRADGQCERILGLLVSAGDLGCTNRELWAVCHAVNSRVSDLRRRGHEIIAKAEGGGIYRYRLVASKPRRETLAQEPPRAQGLLFSGARA